MRHFDSHRVQHVLLTTALTCLVVLAVSADEPKIEVPAYNTMSDRQEISLGREAAAGIEKERKLSFVSVPLVQEYVSTLGRKLATTSRRPGIPYSFKVVDTMEVNAFALPGGFVYVNRGLIEWARTESELAAVLGHEIGHVVGRHGANNVSRVSTADSLVSEASRILLGDDTPARMLKQIGGPVAFLALLKYSRTAELEADLLAYYHVQRGGWNASGMVDLFAHLGERAPNLTDAFGSFASSHPTPAEREAQIKAEMAKFPPKSGLARSSDAFAAAQAELKKLPRPRPAS
jgi:predicted Zn-dependent protease